MVGVMEGQSSGSSVLKKEVSEAIFADSQYNLANLHNRDFKKSFCFL